MQSLGSFPINWKYNLPIALKADPKTNTINTPQQSKGWHMFKSIPYSAVRVSSL